MRRKGTAKVRPTIYLDTCVIVSFIDEADANHTRAIRLVERLREERIVSRLTLLELASVYSRAGLEEPLPLTVYSVRAVGARLVNLDFNEVLREAFAKALLLRFRTLACSTWWPARRRAARSSQRWTRGSWGSPRLSAGSSASKW